MSATQKKLDYSRITTEFAGLPLSKVTDSMLKRYRRFLLVSSLLTAGSLALLVGGSLTFPAVVLKAEFQLGSSSSRPLVLSLIVSGLLIFSGVWEWWNYRSRASYARHLTRKHRWFAGPWRVNLGRIEWFKEFESTLTVGMLAFVTTTTLIMSALQSSVAEALDNEAMAGAYTLAFAVVILLVTLSIIFRRIYRSQEMANGIAEDELSAQKNDGDASDAEHVAFPAPHDPEKS